MRNIFLNILKTALIPMIGGSSLFFNSCASAPLGYELPSKDDYQGYIIIDAVDKNSIFRSIDKNEKIAIVVRDIATTSYSYLSPKYNNSMATFEGQGKCCLPNNGPLMGNSGMAVYKFSFIGKGKTSIKLIARQKGLNPNAGSFETDHVTEIALEVND